MTLKYFNKKLTYLYQLTQERYLNWMQEHSG
jgi:hypothetical protein